MPLPSVAPIAELHHRRESATDRHLVRGRITAELPHGAGALELALLQPAILPRELAALWSTSWVVAQLDSERILPYERPDLERRQRARNFYVSDGTGEALVLLADTSARLHPNVDVHLSAVESRRVVELGGARAGGGPAHFLTLHSLSPGDEVWILGRPRLAPDLRGRATYRSSPQILTFDGTFAPLVVWDQM